MKLMKTDSILTKREAQVAELCVRGYIGKEIADKLKSSIGILSDATLWRYRSGSIRPNILQRRQLANIIRRHSGNSSYTADNLFPVEFYE